MPAAGVVCAKQPFFVFDEGECGAAGLFVEEGIDELPAAHGDAEIDRAGSQPANGGDAANRGGVCYSMEVMKKITDGHGRFASISLSRSRSVSAASHSQ